MPDTTPRRRGRATGPGRMSRPAHPARRATIGSLLLVAVAAVTTPSAMRAQVSLETVLDADGYGSARVRNPSAEIVDVVIELRHGRVTPEEITLGAAVHAVVSPERFALAPGESQTLRLLVRERVARDAVLRLVATLTPRRSTPLPTGRPGQTDSTSGAQARLVFATRFITRVVRGD